MKYLLKRETKDKFSDEHLWFSIIARPTLSTFTRTDRLTCGFVILYMTMLTNILYYEVDTSKKTEGLKIGPFSFTPQQVYNFYYIHSLNLITQVFLRSIFLKKLLLIIFY